MFKQSVKKTTNWIEPNKCLNLLMEDNSAKL